MTGFIALTNEIIFIKKKENMFPKNGNVKNIQICTLDSQSWCPQAFCNPPELETYELYQTELINLLTFLLSVTWKDWYHPGVSIVNMKPQQGDC